MVIHTGAPVVICDTNGQWTRQGNCTLRPYYYVGPMVLTCLRYFSVPTSPSVGWKICMYGTSNQGFTHYHLDFKYYSTFKSILSIKDETSTASSNTFNVYDNGGGLIETHTFGTKQNMKGTSNLNINLTLVDYTQFKVDISPIGYSVTTPHIASTSIQTLSVIALSAVEITIDIMDCNCPT